MRLQGLKRFKKILRVIENIQLDQLNFKSSMTLNSKKKLVIYSGAPIAR